MTALDRTGAIIAAVVFVFGIGVGWNSLNNRIDRVDEKIGAIQKTLGSTTCNAILTRQIEAIEKGRAEARRALEGLSEQYDCVPRDSDPGDMNLSAAFEGNAVMMEGNLLANQLDAVDTLLNEQN